MNINNTQRLILIAAGDSLAGSTLAHIATKVDVANPKRACEALVKRGLIAATEIKLTNGIGKAAGYKLTKAGEDIVPRPAKPKAKPEKAPKKTAPPAGDHRPDGIEYVEPAKAKPKAKPKAKAPAKAEKAEKPTAPREGTRVRGIFDILTRAGGATNSECKAANLGDVSLKHHATRMAERFGLKVKRAKEGRGERVSLL